MTEPEQPLPPMLKMPWRTAAFDLADGTVDLCALQRLHKQWEQYNFPDTSPAQVMMGLIEELGELAHAQLKLEQGTRGPQEQARSDAVGDVVMYLIHFCNKVSIDFEACVALAWETIRERDFIRYPTNGLTE